MKTIIRQQQLLRNSVFPEGVWDKVTMLDGTAARLENRAYVYAVVAESPRKLISWRTNSLKEMAEGEALLQLLTFCNIYECDIAAEAIREQYNRIAWHQGEKREEWIARMVAKAIDTVKAARKEDR